MFDYFYGAQAEQFSFYRVPKVLFTKEKPKGARCFAILNAIYGARLS